MWDKFAIFVVGSFNICQVSSSRYLKVIYLTDLLKAVIFFPPAGQRVIGEAVVSGLLLDDSWLWNPDFNIAAQ